MTSTNLPERRPSPLLSNNPFRNRATSPNNLPSPSSPNFKPSMTSTNPFLDATDQGQTTRAANGGTSPQKPALTGSAAELFENLTLDDGKNDKPVPQPNGAGRRPENVPPTSRRMPPSAHHPSRSRDEEDRHRRPVQGSRGKNGELIDVFADPSERRPRERRPRRNSDTSVIDRSSKSLETDEERRRRHKERERERRRHGSRHTSSRHKGPNHRLDVIDKLDVTSIFGTGVFHHDGPFDACAPSRNRKGLRTAPMMAFPKDSVNMALGGAGPVNKDIDHAQFHGIGVDAYNDYSNKAAPAEPEGITRPPFEKRSEAFNPTLAAEPVHGDESVGLGTSTFLEGAPASRAAIAKIEEENEAMQAAMNAGAAGGLGRKKSLAQRIRGISNARPVGVNGRMTSPEPSYPLQRQRTMSPSTPPLATSGPGSARPSETNPFFQDYDKEYERKSARIANAETMEERPRAVSSPRRPTAGLERAITNESIGGGEASKTGGGLLQRVKSLKGGPRKTRPERRDLA